MVPWDCTSADQEALSSIAAQCVHSVRPTTDRRIPHDTKQPLFAHIEARRGSIAFYGFMFFVGILFFCTNVPTY